MKMIYSKVVRLHLCSTSRLETRLFKKKGGKNEVHA